MLPALSDKESCLSRMMGEEGRLKRGRGRSGRCRNGESEHSQFFPEIWLVRRKGTRWWQKVELGLRKAWVVVVEDGRTLGMVGRRFLRPEDRIQR